MHPVLQIVVAAAIAIVAGIYVSEHVTCWHIPYLSTNCVVRK